LFNVQCLLAHYVHCNIQSFFEVIDSWKLYSTSRTYVQLFCHYMIKRKAIGKRLYILYLWCLAVVFLSLSLFSYKYNRKDFADKSAICVRKMLISSKFSSKNLDFAIPNMRTFIAKFSIFHVIDMLYSTWVCLSMQSPTFYWSLQSTHCSLHWLTAYACAKSMVSKLS